jgi:hypothetical protein
MHLIWSLIFLALLLLSSKSGSDVNATSCKNNKQCTVSHRICELCVKGKGPTCTTGICLNGQCVTIGPCSLQLSGKCNHDGNCVRNELCRLCTKNTGPTCATGKCVNGQCALIEPYTIQLN